MKTIQIQKRRRKTMNKKEVEGIEKVIKEYLKKNLRMESRVRYLDAYSQPETRELFRCISWRGKDSRSFTL